MHLRCSLETRPPRRTHQKVRHWPWKGLPVAWPESETGPMSAVPAPPAALERGYRPRSAVRSLRLKKTAWYFNATLMDTAADAALPRPKTVTVHAERLGKPCGIGTCFILRSSRGRYTSGVMARAVPGIYLKGKEGMRNAFSTGGTALRHA